ncbi:Retrovirus-related Pol polyprotein from transposon 412 [Frankliniella fusca]|uniref:RNA-directed DNA polymerase n=1 Tax=Frankliniella fusca TaxID=407009 RepID=A0AAE1L7L8_9NEOP|nr:Retrovirus-related Pol polyprotein from transposon 412 [Frankliniella fusca]
MSEGLWKDLQPSAAVIPQFPVTGLRVTGAVGPRSQNVRTQAYLPVRVGPVCEDAPTLLVPGLMRRLILGADWCHDAGAVLDFHRRLLHLRGERSGGVPWAGCVSVRISRTVSLIQTADEWRGGDYLLLNEGQAGNLQREGVLQWPMVKVNSATCQPGRTSVPPHLPNPSVEEKIRRAVDAAETADDRQKEELHRTLLNQQTGVWRAVVPAALQADVTLAAHEAIGHLGARKVIDMLNERLTWNKMTRQVRQRLSACDLCQRAKHFTLRNEGEQAHVTAGAPGELVVTDLYGPLPPGPGAVQHVMVLMDVCTKHVALYALRQARAPAMLRRVLEHYIPNNGPVRAILSDHGTQYTSKVWVKGLEAAGVRVTHSTIRHPQSNPAERVMRTLGQMFRLYCHCKHTSWPRMLPKIEAWINNTIHDSTGAAPAFLHHGRRPARPWDELLPLPPPPAAEEVTREEALRRAAERTAERAARRKRLHDAAGPARRYAAGDLVLLRTARQSDKADGVISKFFMLYEGPYSVAGQPAPNAYQLIGADGKAAGTHNVVNLRPYHTDGAPAPAAAIVSPLGVTVLGQ